VVPESVRLVDSAESAALAVSNLLKEEQPEPAKQSSTKFFVTDSTQKFQRLCRLFLGRPMSDLTHVELKE
jgi:glutamate racemase